MKLLEKYTTKKPEQADPSRQVPCNAHRSDVGHTETEWSRYTTSTLCVRGILVNHWAIVSKRAQAVMIFTLHILAICNCCQNIHNRGYAVN